MTAKNLWWIVAALTLVVIALWGSKYRSELATPKVIETATLQATCDLRKGQCIASFANGETISLEMTPKSIPLLKPLALTIKLNEVSSPINIEKIQVDFVGIGMDMGFNRATLKLTQPQLYQGQAVLPICTQHHMDWEARVLIHSAAGIKAAIFPFHTIKE